MVDINGTKYLTIEVLKSVFAVRISNHGRAYLPSHELKEH